MNPKTKRILAWIGIFLLIGMNILTFIFGISSNADLNRLAWPCFFLSWLIPLVIFLNIRLIDYIRKGQETNEEDDSNYNKN